MGTEPPCPATTPEGTILIDCNENGYFWNWANMGACVWRETSALYKESVEIQRRKEAHDDIVCPGLLLQKRSGWHYCSDFI